jgi:signal transduction histidine kinase
LLPEADGELARTLTSIQVECTRLSDLMTGMLAWAKPVQPNFGSVALDEVFEHLLNRFRSKLDRRNVRLIYSAAAGLPPIHADVRLIEQVLTNLVDNALQAMPAGGQLMVDLNSERRPTGVVVEARIGDTGPGISEENRRRIFDPYFTTKADGNGLGLAICKRLITVHHGAIAVESFPGTGTIFTLTLPAHPAPIAKDNPA